MKIVIHIGMHKTGSSSIQSTFARLEHPDLEYIDWGISGNHSALFVLLFEDIDKLAEYDSFAHRGSEFIQGLPMLRKEWQEHVSNQLAQAGTKTVVFSAESISAPSLQSAVQRMHAFFSDWSNEVTVIGYARPPGDFRASAFQQRLKGGFVPNLSDGSTSPQYRRRFEHIDRILGRENVVIKSFMPDQLLGRDVVKDFADLIGVAPLADDQIIRTNESLSLEAVALLYVQRKLGRGFVAGFDGAHSANNAYISRLATIGHRKFCFSPQMLAPLLEAERDDIAWMEDRLGQPFSDVGAAHPEAISSLDELVDVALQQFDAVQELLGDKAVTQGPTTPETLVQALEQLREGCYEEVSAVAPRQVKATSQFLTGKGAKSMPSETVRSKATEEELRLRTKLARILWHNDHLTDMPSDPEERKVAFGNVAKDYQRKALDLTRRLERNNLKLVELETQD